MKNSSADLPDRFTKPDPGKLVLTPTLSVLHALYKLLLCGSAEFVQEVTKTTRQAIKHSWVYSHQCITGTCQPSNGGTSPACLIQVLFEMQFLELIKILSWFSVVGGVISYGQ